MLKTIKVSDLAGDALDWAVATCEARNVMNERGFVSWPYLTGYSPSTNWALGGPIIEREMIQLTPHCMINPLHGWAAAFRSFDEDDDVYALHRMRGKTPLLAGMRCYVASKLGDKIEIPEGLL